MRAELNVCCIFVRDLTGFSAKKHALIYEKTHPKQEVWFLGWFPELSFVSGWCRFRWIIAAMKIVSIGLFSREHVGGSNVIENLS